MCPGLLEGVQEDTLKQTRGSARQHDATLTNGVLIHAHTHCTLVRIYIRHIHAYIHCTNTHRDHAKMEQLLVREAECHDRLAQLYYEMGMHEESKKEHEDVQRLRKKLGKDVLRSVISDESGQSIKRRV